MKEKIQVILLSMVLILSVFPKESWSDTQKSPSYGGVLKIAVVNEADAIGNPPTMRVLYDLQFVRPVVETLIRADETGAPVPWLATGWKSDEKARTLTILLREGIKFHDGTDFNASAVKWNLDRFIASERVDLASVKSVDIIDDKTVRLNLKENDSRLLYSLTIYAGQIISPTAWHNGGNTDDERDAWAEKHPVGTGPFKFVDWKRSVKLVYDKYDEYWQEGKPYLDGIEIVFIQDQVVASAAFMRGEVDILFSPSPQATRELENSGKYNAAMTKFPSMTPQLMADTIDPNSPFSKLEVRQAMEHAIDRAAIAKSLGFGYWQPMTQWAVKGSWAYNQDVKAYPYDQGKAKQLLAKAGYPKGFDTTLMAISIPPFPDVAAAIQSYLKKAGIRAKIEIQDPPKYLQTQSKRWNFTNGIVISLLGIYPNDYVSHCRSYLKGAHEVRYPNLYIPEEYESILAKAVGSSDQGTIKDLVHSAQKLYVDKYCLSTYLFAANSVSVKNKKVHDDNINTFQTDIWTPENAWIER